MVENLRDLCYFEEIAPGKFRANDPARGPWSPEHCHAGPVTGLVARAFERAVPEKMLTRLTLDLVRATPMAELQVVAKVSHEGRSVASCTAEVRDAEGQICVTASSMHLARKDYAEMPTAPIDPPRFENATIGGAPLPTGAHEFPIFGDFIEAAYPAGVLEDNGQPRPGPKTVWMRTPPLLAGETPSPIQSLCPLADCGNGVSYNAPIREINFMNTDLTIHIHREPESDWLAMTSKSHWRKNGIGMSQSEIFDRHGPVATALQSIMLRPQKS